MRNSQRRRQRGDSLETAPAGALGSAVQGRTQQPAGRHSAARVGASTWESDWRLPTSDCCLLPLSGTRTRTRRHPNTLCDLRRARRFATSVASIFHPCAHQPRARPGFPSPSPTAASPSAGARLSLRGTTSCSVAKRERACPASQRALGARERRQKRGRESLHPLARSPDRAARGTASGSYDPILYRQQLPSQAPPPLVSLPPPPPLALPFSTISPFASPATLAPPPPDILILRHGRPQIPRPATRRRRRRLFHD